LDGAYAPHLVPLISEDWKRLFQWRGVGPFPETEKQRLRQLVDKAHQQRRLVRFWGTVDKPEMWSELFRARVDLINTDDLTGLRTFLRNQKPAANP
jgi:hypothetical protein